MPLDKPFEKSSKTVTFVGLDGNTLEVVSNISKKGLAVLRKQGFKKQSEHLREQEEEALKKSEAVDEEKDDDEDEDEHDPPQPETTSTGPDLAVKKTPTKGVAGRRA